MPKNFSSRMMAGALLSAVLTAGSLSLAATAASASPNYGGERPPIAKPQSCPDPECIKGPPPAAASPQTCLDPKCISGTPPVAQVSSLECSDPKCVPGTLPLVVPRPAARPAINCPPAVAARAVTAGTGGGPGC